LIFICFIYCFVSHLLFLLDPSFGGQAEKVTCLPAGRQKESSDFILPFHFHALYPPDEVTFYAYSCFFIKDKPNSASAGSFWHSDKAIKNNKITLPKGRGRPIVPVSPEHGVRGLGEGWVAGCLAGAGDF